LLKFYFPWKFGFLFSANAFNASIRSSVGITCEQTVNEKIIQSRNI